MNTMRSLAGIIVCLAILVLAACRPGEGAESEFHFWDVRDRAWISLQDAERLNRPGVVLVGEEHDNPVHHAGQLAVIRSLEESGARLAVGLEMMPRQAQSTLDAWVAGTLEEEAMRRAFLSHWQDWPLYREIFLHCRERSIPMVGLNVPRRVTAKVAREGFASLSEEELGLLPPIVCRVEPEYEAFLRDVLGGHHGGSGSFENFCEAQLVWDTAMAVHALDYFRDEPEATMVVLCGLIHAWKPAIAAQLLKQSATTRVTSILPVDKGRLEPGTVAEGDCDYLLGPRP